MFRKEGILFISLGLFFYIASICALENNSAGQLKQNKAHRVPLPTITEIEQLPQDGGDEFNRLIFESSPYLLQHARNPIDWYPWSKEAFQIAQKLDLKLLKAI